MGAVKSRRSFSVLCGLLCALALPLGAPAAEPGPAAVAAGCPPESWTLAELRALPAAEFAVAEPARRNQLALGLASCLENPDPRLRDEVAFTAIAHWLRAKELAPATVVGLARELLPRLEGPAGEGFGRPFAALVLSEVARADRLDPMLPEPLLRELVTAAGRFLAGIRDYRGFDPEVGWRHGVAHGADLVLQLGLSPRLSAAEVRTLLAALARQVAPEATSYIDGEPERLARAVFFLHQRADLDAAFWDGWFAAVGDPAPLADWSSAFAARPGLARRHNTLAFLHAVAFAARANPSPASDRLGALAHRELLRVTSG